MTQKLPLLLQILTLALIAFMVALVWWSPLVYDTDHLGDTLFIMGAGWRDYLGLQPTVDFNHFYGGLTSGLISLSMQIFGPTIKAYDYALILLVIMATIGLGCISWKRMSFPGVLISLCLIAVLALTRHPLEVGQVITKSYSTHSFLYNRIGLILFILIGLYAALPSRARVAEIGAGILIGFLLLGAALAKPTFLLLLPFTMLAMVLQVRWVGLAALTVGFGVALMVLDPWAARILASYEYVQASVGGRADAQIIPLIRKVIMMLFVQPLALGLVALSLGLLLICTAVPWRFFFAAACMAAAGLGMAATMGGGGSLGHLAIPILGLLLIQISEKTRETHADLGPVFLIPAIALAGSFLVPHAANLLGTTLESLSKRDRALIVTGPYADYLGYAQDDAGRLVSSDQYQMFADGIRALTGLGDMSDKGIIADNGITFEFALQAAPVGGYPLWPRSHSPEFAAGLGLPAGTSVVMLGTGDWQDPRIGPVLRGKLTDEFPLCRTTGYWEIYMHKDIACPAL